MSFCAASCCICSHKVSCASDTSAFWPIAAALLLCRAAFSCFLRDRGRTTSKTLLSPMVHTIFGAALSAVAQWWSSNDSLPPKYSSVLHLFRSLMPHDTTMHITNVLGVAALAALLCLLAR